MPLAWEGRAKCDSDKELNESSDPPQASFRKNVFQSSQDDDQHIHPEEAKSNVKGRVAGGSYLEEARNAYEENGPLLEVDMDLPLTFTKLEHDKGEFIVLAFAPEDKENPFNRSKRKKMFVSSLLCLMTLFIGLATTAYSSGIGLMTEEFGVSQTLGQLGLFTFNFVCAISPLFLAPFCELVGRNWIYIGSYGSFIIMFVGLALGRNTATIVVCRGLLGLFGCVGTILVGGTFSDIYVTEKRAVPMALFSYSAILGTVAAPIYSGFIDQALGWRWTQGIQGLSNIPLFVAILFCFPETRGGAVLKTRAKAIRKATGDERYKARMEVETRDIKAMLHASSVKAVHMLVTQPVVFAFGLWIAFAWFVTFLFLSVITITFQEKRGWSLDIGGLPYISLAIGVTIAFLTNFLQIGKYQALNAEKKGGVPPESRLYGAMFGSVWLPVGLFVYSFTQYAHVPWIAPTIALAPIAIGIFYVFECCYSYTADCYGENSSSAIAGQGLMRNTLGGIAPLFAAQFFHSLGSQWAGLLLSLVAVVLSFIPFVMFKFGPRLRERSKLAETTEADEPDPGEGWAGRKRLSTAGFAP